MSNTADTRLVYDSGEHIGQPGCKRCNGTGMSWMRGFEGSVSQSCPACFPRYGKPNWKARAAAAMKEGLFAEEEAS